MVAIFRHLRFENTDLLVKAVDVALVEVKRFQFLLRLRSRAARIVDKQANHEAACIACHRRRAIGKRIIEISIRMPLFHVRSLSRLTALEV